MKLIISLFILSQIALGANIQIEAESGYLQAASAIKSHFHKKYYIPKTLIEIKVVRECSNKRKANTLIVCLINKKGPVFKSDPYIINALLSFGDLND